MSRWTPSRATLNLSLAAAVLLVLTACTAGTKNVGTRDRAGTLATISPPASESALIYQTGTPAPPPPQATAIRVASGQPCVTRDLKVGEPSSIEGETGEHNVLVTLTNDQPITCWLRGTPSVTAYDNKAKQLRTKSGPGHYVTSRPAQTLSLPPGSSAYVLVAKYRCDEQPSTEIDVLRLAMPQGGTANVDLPTGIGMGVLDYCLAASDAAGRYLAVSPIASTPMRTTGWGD